MFNSLLQVVYQVPDLGQAREWYCQVLDKPPAFDSPFAAAFVVGSCALMLVPRVEAEGVRSGSVIAYWSVDDIGSAYQRLLELGATAHSEINTTGDIRRARVVDPFGNILGLISQVTDGAKRTVEKQPSETAYNVALARAIAAKGEPMAARGPDYLAEIFLTEDSRRAIQDPASREYIKKMMTPELFGFLSARTTWLDQIFIRSLAENCPQIVLLGAGYDSRSYRFRDQVDSTRLFELDVSTTQERKQKALEMAGVFVPGQLVFVPINFKTESIAEALTGAGFQDGAKTLFIWEGVSYYLTAEAVEETLKSVREIAPAGSELCFDYMSRLRPSRYAGEPFQFHVPSERMEAFLAERGFILAGHFGCEDIKSRFLPHGEGLPEARSLPELGFIECSVA